MTRCAFCGETRVVHNHHVIPRRFGGSDDQSNLLQVCPTCHAIVEETWDAKFYDAIGARQSAGEEYRKGVLDAGKQVSNVDIETRQTVKTFEQRAAAFSVRTSAICAIADLLDDVVCCIGCEGLAQNNPCEYCGTWIDTGEIGRIQ